MFITERFITVEAIVIMHFCNFSTEYENKLAEFGPLQFQ